MQVLVAPGAFKGTLTPLEVAEAICSGLAGIAQLHTRPIADGGDGTLEVLHYILQGEWQSVRVADAAGVPHAARWLRNGELGVVELAECCGLAGLGSRRLPLDANTYGLGEAIRSAIAHPEVERIAVAVGGSASTDGGAGCLSALGLQFLDPAGLTISSPTGRTLSTISSCNLLPRDKLGKPVTVLTDVTNPLLGPRGAAAVFAPQKGATPAEVGLLEEGLRNFASVLESSGASSIRELAGTGAAGGTAYGLAAALGANIVSGFDWIASEIGLLPVIEKSNLVITGEGAFDQQSMEGKATGQIINLSLRLGRPVWVLSALNPGNLELQTGVSIIVPERKNSQSCTSEDIAAAVRDRALSMPQGA